MKISKSMLLIISLILLFLVGLSLMIRVLSVNEDLKYALKKTEQIVSERTQELVTVNNELVNKENMINELNQKNNSLITENNGLITEIKNFKNALNESHFNVFEEKLLVNKSDILLPTSMNIQQIKKRLGEPLKVEEYIEAHGSGNVLELSYNEALFTFNKDNDKERIKWYKIKSPYFMTNRGITVGSSREEVKDEYSNNYAKYVESSNEIKIGEKTGISFIFDDDIVKEISVWFMYE